DDRTSRFQTPSCRTKLQIPSAKSQRNSNFRAPNRATVSGAQGFLVCPATCWSSAFRLFRAANMLKHELQRFTFAKEKTLERSGGRVEVCGLRLLWDLALGIWSFVR